MTNLALNQYRDRLNAEKQRLSHTHMCDMFESDPDRFNNMSIENDGVIFDYSKNRLDAQSLSVLAEMAKAGGLAKMRSAMFAGDKINTTENRAVLHTALRNPSEKPIMVDGKDIMQDIHAELSRMAKFASSVRDGSYLVSGGKVTDVVNIGIGGSDLGPRMATQSLREFNDGPKLHFVANSDATDLDDIVERLDPKTTLFIVASKSFTTAETMLNAANAKQWVEESLGDEAGRHFCALSTNLEATQAFGIENERTFGFWDWVGGRYSIWSAIGLSLMISIGPERFREFLNGAHSADQHFMNAPFEKNIPIVMGLIGIWYRNVWGFPVQAVMPYDSRMSRFPAWLQQLDMESNGKSVLKSGEQTELDTGPIIFGEVGTNGQHAFYQLLHQGTTIIPCDFLIAATGYGRQRNRDVLLSNCFAQSEALMDGRTLEQADNNPHRVFEGNRPSNTFLFKRVTPHSLGMLMAFYEHKVFVQGVLWGINSFDQWGVELGKELLPTIEPMLDVNSKAIATNGSTKGLLKALHQFKQS
jgi:glucose-6-phosphate isomerase